VFDGDVSLDNYAQKYLV